jgi:hypothetical protein
MKKDITELFCLIDDFTKYYEEQMKPSQLSAGLRSQKRKTRIPGLVSSEIISIILLFQTSPCKNFKYYYNSYAQLYKPEFPGMPCYARFVALKPRVIHIMATLTQSLLSKKTSLEHFIDATSLAVCSTKRISSHKVMKGLAKIGKTTKGWFYGFKLHIVINTKGEIVDLRFTRGNKADISVLDELTKDIAGSIFGDKAYISKKLFSSLYKRGLKLVTGIKKGMDNLLISTHEKLMLRKRSLVETVFDYLKNKFQLEHTRHRSHFNYLIHIMSTLIQYQLKTSKPSISLASRLFINP